MVVLKQYDLVLNEDLKFDDFKERECFDIIYIGERFAIKCKNKYVSKDLTYIDSESDLFTIESIIDGNATVFRLMCDDKIVIDRNFFILEDTSSPYIEAIKYENNDLLINLMNSGVNYSNCVNLRSSTLFHFLLYYPVLLRIFLDNLKNTGINLLGDPSVQNTHSKNILHILIMKEDFSTILLLINYSKETGIDLLGDINIKYGPRKETLLMQAINSFNPRDLEKVVNFLIENSLLGDINIQDYEGYTAFMVACISCTENVINYFISRNIVGNLDLVTRNGETLVAVVCKYCSINVVNIIIKHNFIGDVNSLNADGNTPFMLSCMSRHNDVTELLIMKKLTGDFTIKNNDGKTAYDLATNARIKKRISRLK